MPLPTAELAAALTALLGDGSVLSAADLGGRDPGVDLDNLAAGLAVAPRSTAEVAKLIGFCAAERIPVVAQGGRTGLCGGARSQPGEVILLTERMNAIEEIDPLGATALVGAGAVLQTVDEAAARHGLTIGVDLGARGSARIGGMISTNAGGIAAFRHGVMRQRVLGLEAVLADGSVLSDLTRSIKVNDGYDVKQLLIGSEGTLGVVTRAVLKLEPRIEPQATALCACPTVAAAIALYARLRRRRDLQLLAAELMWDRFFAGTVESLGLPPMPAFSTDCVNVLIEVAFPDIGDAVESPLETVLMAAAEAGEIGDAMLVKNQAERAMLWSIRESWALEDRYRGRLWYDVSVPHREIDGYVSGLEARLAAIDPGIDSFLIGHLGDGNLHLSLARADPYPEAMLQRVDDAVYGGLLRLGGAISAEHGVGLNKRASLHKYVSPEKLRLMRVLKAALDPHNILNPGKVV